MEKIFPFFIALALTIQCSPNGEHKVSDTSQPNAAGEFVGFDRVQPVFAQYCSACHPSRSAPDWLDYSQALPYTKNGLLLKKAVKRLPGMEMPPPGSPQSVSMPQSARDLIRDWINAGGPKESKGAPGNPSGSAPTQVANPLLAKCLQCHGSKGPGSEVQPRIPILAGQNMGYMILQLNWFKWRQRLDPTNAMNEVAAELSKNQIRETARHFSHQQGLAPEQMPPFEDNEKPLYEAGKKIAEDQCISCHMNPQNDNRPPNDLLPVLAGQSRQYLINQLLYFRDDERRSPEMHHFAQKLTDDQIEQLAIFFARSR